VSAGLTDHHVKQWWRGILVASLCCAAGCRGSGRLHFASLDYRDIDPQVPPRLTAFDLQECYWWTDEGGRLWMAMQRQHTPLFYPKMRFEFQLSVALERLPAGRARTCKVDRTTLRARVCVGPWESRFTSRVGVIAVCREPGDRLRGSLRLQAVRVASHWLGGWGKPSRYLLLGSFTAVPDERRGRAIAEATESSGWGRDSSAGPPITSRPARPPPSSSRASSATDPRP
jgi:hypothetical protein